MNVIKTLKSRQAVKAPKPRNPVVVALNKKAGGSGAGAHRKSRGAERRAQRMAIRKELQSG